MSEMNEMTAGESIVAGRGLSSAGGIFNSEENETGGEVWTSEGNITQNDFAPMVNGGVMKGNRVNIITGVHGSPSGSTFPDRSLFDDDTAAFGGLPGVNIYDFNELAAMEIRGLLNGPGTTIGAFCNSGACLAPYW